MKKILTVSIMAVMAVTAANAEIASKAYVDQRETAAVNTAKGYTDTKIGNIDGADVAAAIAKAVTGGTENVVTHTGAVGNATTPVYITAEGVATAGTALGTMATENAADYTKTGLDTTYAKASDFTTLQSAVNDATNGLAATKAIADANKAAIDALDDDYVSETDLTTALEDYTKTGLDTTYAKQSDFSTLQTAVNDSTNGLAATKAIADANKAAIENTTTGLAATKAIADANKAAIENTTTGLAATKAIADANKAAIENSTTGLAATKAIADEAKATADAAIPAPQTDCTNLGAKCVLTVGTGGVYAWEVVQRGTGE